MTSLVSPLGTGSGGGAATPAWYLAGGVTPVAAYLAKGAATYAASKSNLANPGTYDLTDPAPPTWDTAIGWTFDGTQYLKTGIPCTKTQTIMAQLTNAGSGSPGLFWCAWLADGAADNYGAFNGAGGITYYPGGTAGYDTSHLTNGNICWQVEYRGYRDALLDGNGLGTSSATLASQKIFIGGESFNNGPNRLYLGDIIAFVVYATRLTPYQVMLTATAMAAL